MVNKKEDSSNRKYIENTIKIVAHPVRAFILKELKERSLTAIELEEITKESRFNIYYHLSALEEAGLVRAVPVDKKTKRYELNTPSRPESAVLIFSEDEIKKNAKAFATFLAAAAKMEKAEIPYPKKIVRAEISFYYSWD